MQQMAASLDPGVIFQAASASAASAYAAAMGASPANVVYVNRTDLATGNLQWSAGGGFQPFLEPDSGWLQAPLPAGWSGNIEYRKVGAQVTVMIAGLTTTTQWTAADVLITTIPAGYRPRRPILIAGVTGSTTPIWVKLDYDGTVKTRTASAAGITWGCCSYAAG
jgi:hypothetical protein